MVGIHRRQFEKEKDESLGSGRRLMGRLEIAEKLEQKHSTGKERGNLEGLA